MILELVGLKKESLMNLLLQEQGGFELEMLICERVFIAAVTDLSNPKLSEIKIMKVNLLIISCTLNSNNVSFQEI